MMRALLLLSLLILPGCSSDRPTPAAAYAKWTDRLIVSLGLEYSVGTSCWEKVGEGDESGVRFIGEEKCFRFDPPERIKGVWMREYEGSSLLTQAQYDAGLRFIRDDDTWLEPFAADRPPVDEKDVRAYRVEFIGRRSSYPGAYGHMGGSRHIVLLDRMISIEEIKAK